MAKHTLFYAVVLPGLEQLAAAELEALSAHDIEIEHGGVSFSGTTQLMYRVNLRSRVITRVLMRLRSFRNMTLEGLGFEIDKIAWHLFLNESSKVNVSVSTKHSRLNHSEDIADYVSLILKKAMPKIGTSNSALFEQSIHIRIENNRGTISLDTSGERLDRRGYRLESGKAPMRETLAAAMISWSGWQPEQTLLVPMCGSGTLAIEAGLVAKQQAPNLNHDFACLHWHNFKAKDFEKVVERCMCMLKNEAPKTANIFASDINAGGVSITQNNAQRADVTAWMDTTVLDVHNLVKPDSPTGGVVLLNPPYAQRIGETASTVSLWSDLGQIMRQQFLSDPAWKVVVICPEQSFEKAMACKVSRRLKVTHGGESVYLLELASIN